MREHAQQNISYHIKNYDNITSRDQRGKKIKYNDRSIKHTKKKNLRDWNKKKSSQRQREQSNMRGWIVNN